MINQRELFKLESKLKRGNKTIPVKALEKDYVLSWILIGISKSKIQNKLVFKGGTALKKFYFDNYRFSEDLDFTLIDPISIEDIETMLQEVYSIVLEMVNINLALKSKESHINGYTFFINFSGPLAADITRGEIKVDFTIKEKIINQPIIKYLLREYEEYSDIPKKIELKIYTIEEVFLEKYLCILDKSRNEPRDVYDLWYLISNNCLDYEYLDSDIKNKGKFKGISSFDIIKAFERKEKNYKKLWLLRLEQHMVDLPLFDKVYRELRKSLRIINKKLQ